MMNFKNTKMAKVISGFVGISTAVMMMGPVVASAATEAELTAQINALSAQIAALKAAQTSSSSSSVTTTGHVFKYDLTIGSRGADVIALQTVLVTKGFLVMPAGVSMGYFGPLTRSAVARWQVSANIYPTAGYFGPKSRAAFNAMVSSTTIVNTTTTTTTTWPTGCTSALGFSPTTGLSCATGAAAVVTGTGVSATLDTASPAASTLISPQGVATLAIFKLTNAGSSTVKVTMMKFKRTGVSSDSTLNNVYLYSGATRLTDSASISTGVISFTDTAGLISIPAGSSVSVSVRADVASGMSGQTVGVMLTDVTTDAGTATGLPVSGAQHTAATAPTGMTTVDFTGSTVPASATSIDPQNDYTVWQRSINVGSRDANLSSIRFQQLGSVGVDDVKNFRLMIDGVIVGSAVEKVDANRYVTFTLPTPAMVKAGSHVVKVVADLVGGSTRTVQLSLRRAIDVEMTDSQLNVAVTPTVGATTFSAMTTGLITIQAGALTITKATDSPSGNVVLQGSGVTLAKYIFRAAGEKLKVENLTIGYTGSTSGALRNGAIFANGVQIGSTQTIVPSGTLFNLGSSLQIEAGQQVTVEVRADVYSTIGQFVANDTIQITTMTGSSNVYGASSLQYTSSQAVVANTVTVAAGSITLAKYSAYANQTVVVPQTAYKLGEFRLTTGSTEGANLDTITLALSGTMTATELSNVYVTYGSKTTAAKATGAASQTWSISEAVPANTTLNVAVYGTLSGSSASGSTTISTLTMSGTSPTSGNAVTSSAVVGQTITVGTGSITSAVDASTPVSTLVVGNSMPKVASFKFTTTNDSHTITELAASVGSTNAAATIKNLVFKDGATTLATQPMNGMYATSTGLSVVVGSNATKVIDVYADLGSIGTGFASTSQNIQVTLNGFEKMTSGGVKSRIYPTAVAGNAIYVYKAKPTITNVTLPSTVLTTGTVTIGKVTVMAEGGTIAWREMVFTFSTSTPSGAFTMTSPTLVDDSGTAITGVTVTMGTGATGTITASSTAGAADQEVSGSKTYTLKATIGGSPVVGSSVATNIASSGAGYVASTDATTVASGAATFTWSDMSSSPHTALTQDWNNDNLVKNIPTDSQSLSK